ncbi:MAG: hypothetical protein U1E78_08870 [Gammaproteobacteria bacterium]
MGRIERYRAYHLFLMDMVEDILATTLLVPFTMALHAWNSFADSLIEVPHFEAEFSSKVWRTGRFVLTAPLHALKGILGLTILPLIAICLAAPSQTDDAVWKNYNYPLGRIFQEMALSIKVRVFLVLNFEMPDDLLGDYFWPILLASIFGGGTFALLASSFLSFNSAYMYSMWLLPLYTPYISMFLSAPLSVTFAIGLTAILGWADAKTAFLTTKIQNGLEHLEDFIKIKLYKHGKKYSFQNKNDILGDDLERISEDQLLITNTGYAINIDTLIDQFKNNGFTNPHVEDRNQGRLSLYEVEKIERLGGLKRFPALKQYIQEHKKELAPGNASGISKESIQALREYARAIRLTQQAENFAEQMAAASDKFEAHMNSITPEEKEKIENLNLLGGNDPTYEFKNVMEKVFKGEWCKKGAASLTLETCERLEHANETGRLENSVFWQRPHPTHWMRAGRVIV